MIKAGQGVRENTQVVRMSQSTVTNAPRHILQEASIAVASTGLIKGSDACQVSAITCVEPVEASAALVFLPVSLVLCYCFQILPLRWDSPSAACRVQQGIYFHAG